MEKLKPFIAGSICKECMKNSFLDERTSVLSTYCRHNETGALMLPIMGEIRWLTINRLTANQFAEYVGSVMSRALEKSVN